MDSSDGSRTSIPNGSDSRNMRDCLSRISASTSWMVTALSAMLSRRMPLIIALASTTAIVASFFSSTAASGAGAGAAFAMAAQLAMPPSAAAAAVR
jgi:hypothetical protein